MRMITHNDAVAMTGLIAIAFVVMLFLHLPARPQMWLYPLVRQAAKTKVEFETRHLAVEETEHFIIRYSPLDADVVPMVAKAAEEAYRPVTGTMGYVPQGKTMVVIYHDKAELRQAFGWSGDESAMGVYWGGVIQLLSPHVWMKDSPSVEEFIHSGPMVHEYTHLVFDYLTNGNYPRWFTEGIAQYVEYKVNHYEWLTTDNTWGRPLYSMTEMERSFDDLPNQPLAYRESFAAVRYIAEVHGDDKLHRVISSLQAGQSMEQAIHSSLGMDELAYETAWRSWAVQNMK